MHLSCVPGSFFPIIALCVPQANFGLGTPASLQRVSISRARFRQLQSYAKLYLANCGALFESLNPATVQADGGAPPSGFNLMNAGAFGWNLLSDTAASESADLIENPNILMILVDQLRLPQFWLTPSQQSTVDGMCPNIVWLRQAIWSTP
jgi:hypothetical protein